MISQSLIDFCRQYIQSLNNVQSSSWFSSLSNIVGNMFVSDEGCERVQQIKANNGLLLALYEAVHLNRNFITTLAHTQAESSAPPSPSNTLSLAQPVPDLSNAPIIDITQYPTNLLVAVFQYCSIVMQDNKNESSIANLKLCFLILTCISEDQYANSMFKKSNSDPTCNILNEIFGHEKMDEWLKLLMQYCNRILLGDVPENARFMCLKLLQVLVTGTDNVNQNALFEHLMMHSMFDAFVRLLSDPTFRTQHGHDIVILLTILVNYRKHEATNPYVVQLSILADELALNG